MTELQTETPNISHQQGAYDSAYLKVDLVPFPDHKIEGSSQPVGRIILNIGGGTGSDVAHLASQNEVYVLDYSAGAGQIAKAFGLKHVLVDLNSPDLRLPFDSGSADIVILKDVLEHLLDPIKLIEEAKRVVKPEGYLVISLPNHFNVWGRLRILFGKNIIWRGILHDHRGEYDEWNYMHIRFFTWRGLMKLLKTSGLILERSFLDFGPFGHYFSISMYAEHLQLKEERGMLTSKGRLFLRTAVPLFKFFNFVFPEKLRNGICRLNPSLLTSCFYIHVRKDKLSA